MLGNTLQEIRAAIERMDCLPVSSGNLRALYSLARNHPEDLAPISLLAWSEPGLAVELMARSGSKTFAAALSALGPEQLRAFAHERLVLDALRPTPGEFPMEQGWLDSCLLTAIASEHFAAAVESEYQEEAYLAGLATDVGSMVVRIGNVSQAWAQLNEVEKPYACALAGKWTAARFGLSDTIGMAIWLQHLPSEALPDSSAPRDLIDIVALAKSLMHTENAGETLRVAPCAARLKNLGLTASAAMGIWEEAQSSFHEARKRLAELHASSDDVNAGLMDDLRALTRTTEQLQIEVERNAEAARNAEIRHEFAAAAVKQSSLRSLVFELARAVRETANAGPALCYLADASGNSVEGCSWESARGEIRSFNWVRGEKNAPSSSDIAKHVDTLQQMLAGNETTDVASGMGLLAVPICSGGHSFGQILVDAGTIESPRRETIMASLVAMAQDCAVSVCRIERERHAALESELWAMGHFFTAEDAIPDSPPSSQNKRTAPVIKSVEQPPLESVPGVSQESVPIPVFSPPTRANAESIPLQKATAEYKEASKTSDHVPTSWSLEPALVNLMVKQVLAEFSALANVRGVSLVHELAEGLPRIRVDRSRMRLALRTMLHGMLTENAVNGQIRVSTNANTARTQVFVETANTLPHAEGTTGARRVDMKMLQSLVEQQGGKITTGLIQKGYTLTVSLPAVTDRVVFRAANESVAQPQQPTPKPAQKPGTGTRTVLIIEENRDLREVLAETLRHRGLAVAKLGSVSEGAEACRRHQFDLVLVDLPASAEVARKSLAELAPRLHGAPVLAIVNGAGQLELDDLIKHGANACLSKPFELAELLSRISELFTKYPQRESSGAETKQTA
jgi:CheY-like chemotaxis protein